MSSMGLPAAGQGFFGSAMNGSPSSFTSPPIDPKILAALAALSGSAPMAPQGGASLPPNSVAPGAPQLQSGAPGAPPGGAMPPGGGALKMLQGIDPNILKLLLQRQGIGGPIPGPGMGGVPGQ